MKQFVELFEYYNNEISKEGDVQYKIARFLTGILNPTKLCNTSDVEHLYFSLIKGTHTIDRYDLMENKDRLVPKDTRRMGGEYFTPESMSKFCREQLKKHIDLKDYVIWDMSCGSGNLLRTEKDFDPSKVFMSTLNEADVELIKSTGFYDEQVTVFPCDFLSLIDYDRVNSYFVDTLPDRLKQAIKTNEKILFYFNPPFKSNPEPNIVSDYMTSNSYGKFSNDLYMQFIFKVVDLINKHNLTNAVIGVISPLTYMKNKSGMVDYLNEVVQFEEGYIYGSDFFSDTSTDVWSVSFIIFKHRLNPLNLGEKKYYKLAMDKEKKVYLDKEFSFEYILAHDFTASDWATSKEIEYFIPTTAWKFFDRKSDKEVKVGIKNSIGYVSFDSGHDVKKAGTCTIMNKPQGFTSFIDIYEDNYYKALAIFAAGRCVKFKDSDFMFYNSMITYPLSSEVPEDLKPNLIILSNFDLKSYGFAGYNNTVDRTDRFLNTLFYLAPELIEEKARECGNKFILNDIKENYKSTWFNLQKVNDAVNSGDLWEEARELYELCKNITLDTVKYRELSPEHLNCNLWDAGWIQVRYMLKSLKPLKETESLYFKALGNLRDRMFERIKQEGMYLYDR